ncbi:hypothetical protein E2C01_049054 [Portunus trituberculatus]|uniref:Uncharacterized protein n=1 Tax=Portunus trituberculatus TaxID=210409 RepID=A0A5B7GCX1_PORTR|nr:hypothetical protein [Portunus trituberculatus]
MLMRHIAPTFLTPRRRDSPLNKPSVTRPCCVTRSACHHAPANQGDRELGINLSRAVRVLDSPPSQDTLPLRTSFIPH